MVKTTVKRRKKTKSDKPLAPPKATEQTTSAGVTVTTTKRADRRSKPIDKPTELPTIAVECVCPQCRRRHVVVEETPFVTLYVDDPLYKLPSVFCPPCWNQHYRSES